MQPTLLIPLIVSLLGGGGFVVNEWSHGGLSESVGMGHHHMLHHDDGQPCSQDGMPMPSDHEPMPTQNCTAQHEAMR